MSATYQPASGSDDPDLATADLLEALPFSRFQLGLLLMTGATVVLDGIDNQILGLAAPSLIADWHISKVELGTVFAVGFAGMAAGTVIAGWIGDRFGRKIALVLGVLAFAIATLLTGYSRSLFEMGALRLIAGLGLGGVPGTAAALIGEYMPARFRAAAISFGIICVAIGGIIGGFAAAAILPTHGWRSFFYVGGLVPLVGAFFLLWKLPESPRFLAARPRRHAELARNLGRMGLSQPRMFVETLAMDRKGTHIPGRALFGSELRRDTLALCAALFMGLFLIYSMFNWAPTLLFSNGFALELTHSGLTAFNIGGAVGSVIAGFAMTRLGSRRVLIPLTIIAAFVCAGLAVSPINPGAFTSLLVALLVLGLTGSTVQSTIYAVASHAFPTSLRARGIGVMAGAGRLGAMLSAFAGADLVDWGGAAFFTVLGVVLLVQAICLALLRNHIPAASAA
ncbi:MFS transporter [Sphingomonas sp. AP4-R1]|uniref:MFS transporter n=1 Tax=Sphingomonas sp. AP4-R1 TaxID=2735134 RepID=UPI0020A3455A|nr:MFS transporter [Sphingomonas sp. AP4-R1]